MATVILLRHGRTTSNAGGTLAGHQPTELDDVGRAQATAVGTRLTAAGITPHLVLSSPLIRCRQTLAAALPDAKVEEEPGLIECDYGDWSGQPLKALVKEQLWKVVQAHPSAATFPKGEAMAAMSARAVAAVRAADARATAEFGDDAIVLACSHGDVIKAIVADAVGMHLDLFQRIAVDPASLTVIRYTPLRPFLARLNDIGGDLSGLKPPAKRTRRKRVSSDAEVGGGAGSSTAAPGSTTATSSTAVQVSSEADTVGTATGGSASDRLRSKA